MTLAAQQKKLYHIWWHPHNFGKNIQENLSILAEIIAHFDYLRSRYNFKSLNMSEIGEQYSFETT